MEKILLMFTNGFPYGTGESFIESEILISACIYDKIYICVMNSQRGNLQMRSVPENVKVFVFPNRNMMSKIFSACICLLRGIIIGDLLREWKKCTTINEYKKSLAFYTTVLGRYKWFKRKMIKVHGSRIDFYSYWFLESVYVADLLRKKIAPDAFLITRAHGYDLYTERTSFNYFPFREKLLKIVDRVCPCSVEGEKYLKQKYPYYADKIVCSYLGTKDVELQTKEKDPAVFTLVTCSNIIPLKRVERVAETLALLEQEELGIKIKWYCFGEGELRKAVEEYCYMHLRSTEFFFMGQVENIKLMRFYCSENIDLFVNVSETEGLPVSIMEAFSFGIPTIATRVGGTPEIVLDNINGFLIDKDFTNNELKDFILKYINMSVDQKNSMRKKARECWENKFCAKRNYQYFFEQYDIFVGERNSSCIK